MHSLATLLHSPVANTTMLSRVASIDDSGRFISKNMQAVVDLFQRNDVKWAINQ